MKILPINPTTHVCGHEWIPSSFSAFIQELDRIVSMGKKQNYCMLFRGHSNQQWLLDSTFVRSIKQNIIGIEPKLKVIKSYRHSLEYQRLLVSLLIFKFAVATKPSQDLETLTGKGIDPLFEWMKRIQQYPKEDVTKISGTFLIDWTKNEKVAMYFASEDYNKSYNDGTLFIANLSETGKVLHKNKNLEDILSIYKKAYLADQPLGITLIFFPKKQIECKQADNQEVVYIAQMDMRVDLFEIWEKYEIENKKQVILKLRLPHRLKEECCNWLESNGITKKFLFPKI